MLWKVKVCVGITEQKLNILLTSNKLYSLSQIFPLLPWNGSTPQAVGEVSEGFLLPTPNYPRSWGSSKHISLHSDISVDVHFFPKDFSHLDTVTGPTLERRK